MLINILPAPVLIRKIQQYLIMPIEKPEPFDKIYFLNQAGVVDQITLLLAQIKLKDT